MGEKKSFVKNEEVGYVVEDVKDEKVRKEVGVEMKRLLDGGIPASAVDLAKVLSKHKLTTMDGINLLVKLRVYFLLQEKYSKQKLKR